jgi:hypothetical protein
MVLILWKFFLAQASEGQVVARYTNIFVASGESSDTFAKKIETILNIKLEARPESGVNDLLYRFSDGQSKWFDIIRHTLVNDRHLNFEDYTYELSIGVFGVTDNDERGKRQQDFANEIYAKLKQTNKYSLLMTDDVQIELDRFVPTS